LDRYASDDKGTRLAGATWTILICTQMRDTVIIALCWSDSNDFSWWLL